MTLSPPTAEQMARIICEAADVLVTMPGEPFESEYVCEKVTDCEDCMARAKAIIRLFEDGLADALKEIERYQAVTTEQHDEIERLRESADHRQNLPATLADVARSAHGAILASRPCAHHCVDCEGEDHHWIPECPEDGDPVMVCKHCDAWREMRDDDELV